MPRADEKLGGYTMRKGRDLFIFSRIMSGFVRGAVLAELQPQETSFWLLFIDLFVREELYTSHVYSWCSTDL